MTDTHDDPGPVRWHLEGFSKIKDRLVCQWEIPVRLWPLMGSMIGANFGDGMGEYPISLLAAERLAALIGGSLAAHPNCEWFLGGDFR